MMNQTIPLVPQGWQILARGSQENDQVARCPGGHIHLDYGNLTLRFERGEFLAFAAMVMEAASHLTNKPGLRPGILSNHLSPMTFSLN
jgi:hypothetical protein